MKKITFTIHGNQENTQGNPVPYFRTTQGSRWSPGAKRYSEWKEYVVARYLDAVREQGDESDIKLAEQNAFFGHPIDTTSPVRVAIKVFWADNTHGDLDNILKGILDALFKNDKCVSGVKASGEMGVERKGKVEITISFN